MWHLREVFINFNFYFAVPIHSAAAENEEPDEEQDDIFNPGMIDVSRPT